MYLKSLDIQGFKSFPALTHFEFTKPITAIVGPNGSGKSNVADAILWVMGEQSTKTLRGGKMEDVIFGGTIRRPGQNFAEVSLILDNSEGTFNLDTTEVMLTRRYYRSGESEYFINKTSVRLKEITELLMDTGLGRDGYSVIGQGRIAEIVSAKSKERREIFEEAAGISRYRHKKEEAERKLQATDDNLLRIGDKISELELQYGPLKEQAEQARKYNSLIGELKGIEIALWLKDLESIEERTQKIESDRLDAQRELDAANIEYDEAFAQQKSLEEMTQESNIEAQAMREQISATEKIKNDIESSIAVYKSQLEGNANQIENIKTNLKSYEEQRDGVGSQITDYENELSEISAQKDGINEKIAGLNKELEETVGTSDRCEQTHKELISKEQEMQTQLSDRKSDLSALAAGAQELYDSEQSIKQKHAEAKDDLKIREDEYKKSTTSLGKAQEEAGSLSNVIKGLALKLESKSAKAKVTEETLQRLTAEYNNLQSRHHMLSEWEREHQGYQKSVKTILQEHSRGTLRNIHGTVASLLKTDNTYTTAIETALGGAMQNIVVDTAEDAKAGIELLKRRDVGRARFLPLSTYTGTALSESEFRSDDGFLGVAINLIKFDKKYEGIYTRLLGRVLICEDLNRAIAMSRRHNNKYKIVTLDGQVINADSSMEGGSTVKGAGILSKANELIQIAGRIEACREELKKAEHEHAERNREKNAAQYEYDTAQDELRAANENIKMLELDLSHKEQNLNNAKILIEALSKEAATFDSRLKQNTEETETLKSQITDLSKQLESIKKDIDEAIKDNTFVRNERERITALRSELLAEITGLDAKRDAVKISLSNLRNMREEMTGTRQTQLDTISGLKLDNETIQNNIAEKERELSKIEITLNSENKKLAEIETGKMEVEGKRNRIIAEINMKGDRLNDKTRKKSTLDGKLELIKGEEEHILDKLMSTYNLGPSAAKNHAAPVENITAAKKRRNIINREIEDLGPVNTGAIKEFERVSERYDYLTAQRDDVLDGKTKLLSVIEDLTKEMRGIFTREFELINESFKRTFTELFGGGRAALILEDPDDVLNCGIEIDVQPPGKNVKTMSLSGGEKTFVAIAIYFAILAVRPPPFVVMDEIDAALDDANVVRFSNYMRHVSDKSQMIVITHKRGTMEEADVLYGVTMQELGVSNIMCIDLEEAEKHIGSKVNV